MSLPAWIASSHAYSTYKRRCRRLSLDLVRLPLAWAACLPCCPAAGVCSRLQQLRRLLCRELGSVKWGVVATYMSATGAWLTVIILGTLLLAQARHCAWQL